MTTMNFRLTAGQLEAVSGGAFLSAAAEKAANAASEKAWHPTYGEATGAIRSNFAKVISLWSALGFGH